jgi:hypothetical protein
MIPESCNSLRLARIISAIVVFFGFAASKAAAAPVTVFYSKDAQTTNTVPGGTQTPNIIFSTPIQGLSALTYTQSDETVSATGGGVTAATTYSAAIAPGNLRAASSSTITGSFSGVAGQGVTSSAEQSLAILDSLTANGGAVGSSVNLTLTLSMDALLTFFNVPTSNGVLCGYGSIVLSAAINDNTITSLGRDLCSGSDAQTASARFDAIYGTPFDLKLTMDISTQSAAGASNRIGSSVSIDALNTGKLTLAGPSGLELTSSSGYSYLETVPEPSTLALASIWVLILIARRCFLTHATPFFRK